VTYTVRLTPEAEEGLHRLSSLLLELDIDAAERAGDASENVFRLLAYSPFSCRKALLAGNPRIREVLIPFGRSGYVALFEIENGWTVTVCAVRRHREQDYH